MPEQAKNKIWKKHDKKKADRMALAGGKHTFERLLHDLICVYVRVCHMHNKN